MKTKSSISQRPWRTEAGCLWLAERDGRIRPSYREFEIPIKKKPIQPESKRHGPPPSLHLGNFPPEPSRVRQVLSDDESPSTDHRDGPDAVSLQWGRIRLCHDSGQRCRVCGTQVSPASANLKNVRPRAPSLVTRIVRSPVTSPRAIAATGFEQRM